MIPPDIAATMREELMFCLLCANDDERVKINAVFEWLNTLPAAPDTREALAEYAHEAWSGWMKYLLSKCDQTGNTYATIPTWAVRRWQRQMNTPYAELSEEEKESDRAEADKMLAIMGRTTLQAAPAPDWSQAPSWANWYSIDKDGKAQWWEKKPCLDDRYTWWLYDWDADQGGTYHRHEQVEWIPEKNGIDWRTTLTARPKKDE